MKYFVAFLIFAQLGLTGDYLFGQNENLITDRILYTVRFDNKEGKEGGFYNYLDSTTKTNLINRICDLVFERKLKASHYFGNEVGEEPNYYNTLGEHLTKYYFARNDTLSYRYNSLPYEKESYIEIKHDSYVYRYLINSLSFYEKWYFDDRKNIFSKKVSGVILFEDKYTNNIGIKDNYFIALNDTETFNIYNPKYLIAKNIIYDVPVTKGDTILNEYNWWYNYIEASKRERLFNTFKFKALNDTVLPFKTYGGNYPYDSLIARTEYANVGLGNLFYGRSTLYSSDPLLSGITDEMIQANSYELANWTTIKKLRFNEEWYFDPFRLQFEKKVLGIGIIVDTFNDKGKRNGEKCLIYYKLNN